MVSIIRDVRSDKVLITVGGVKSGNQSQMWEKWHPPHIEVGAPPNREVKEVVAKLR